MWQDATGMAYFRSRYFDPVANRFTQEDPIGIGGGLNLYAFGYADPMNHSDPFGTCPKWLNPEPCNVSLSGLTGNFNWLGANYSLSVGLFDDQAEHVGGWYITLAGGLGNSRLPQYVSPLAPLKGFKKGTWEPTLSATVDGGGSTSLQTFHGSSTEWYLSAGTGPVTGGGSLSGNAHITGWNWGLGYSTPGLKAYSGVMGTHTWTPWTWPEFPVPDAPMTFQADAVADPALSP
jgi:RHS repeat-associated protein